MRTSVFHAAFAASVLLSGPASAVMPATYKFLVHVTQQDSQKVCTAAGTNMVVAITVDRAFKFTNDDQTHKSARGGPGFNSPSPILSVSVNNGPGVLHDENSVYLSRSTTDFGYSFTAFDLNSGITLNFQTNSIASVPRTNLPLAIKPKQFTKPYFWITENDQGPCLADVISREPPRFARSKNSQH